MHIGRNLAGILIDLGSFIANCQNQIYEHFPLIFSEYLINALLDPIRFIEIHI